jgi:DUF4097 and DUF4098 domain-containing protein YvlB
MSYSTKIFLNQSRNSWRHQRVLGLLMIAYSTLVASGALAQGDSYSVQRTANAPTSGITTIRVANGSGRLVITGHSGSSAVNATAIVHGSSQSAVNSVRLVTERNGDVLTVRADRPDQTGFNDDNVYVDLTVQVPSSIALNVEDGSGGARIDNVGALRVRSGSGGVHISNVGGSADLESGSGGAELRNVHGNVTAETGSGGMTIDGVTGSVDVRSAGSGGLTVKGVTGSLHLGSIGSGTLTADNIGGDLTVDSKGSGDVQYTNVKGHVSVPDRRHNR